MTLLRSLCLLLGLALSGQAYAADTVPRTSVEAIGGTSDAKCTVNDAICSVVALLKGMYYNGLALSAGTAVIGKVSIDQTTPGTTNGVTPVVGTVGGATPYFVQPAASDNHAVIKNGAGTAYAVVATNNSVTINYLRLYNAGTGFNGCNSATNLLTQVAILPSGGISVPFPIGLAFTTGLSICVTSGYATTDTTNATASAMSVTVLYN